MAATRVSDGNLPNIYVTMGVTAENVARLRGVSRSEQDQFALRSQNLAEEAIVKGFWEREITPVTVPDGTVVSKDDGPRAGVTLEALSALPPVFREDGTVTAGNCCALNDGAAAVVIMSDAKAASWAHAFRPHRVDRAQRPVPGDHGPWSSGGVPAGPAACRHVDR